MAWLQRLTKNPLTPSETPCLSTSLKCYCQEIKGRGINKLTLQTQHGLVVKFTETWESGSGKKEEEAVILCVSCGFQRGDRVSTTGRGRRQPGGIPLCPDFQSLRCQRKTCAFMAYSLVTPRPQFTADGCIEVAPLLSTNKCTKRADNRSMSVHQFRF